MLKSLVDWEKKYHASHKQNTSSQSIGEDASVREPMEVKNKDDVQSNFEKAKAHKSTTEAAIAEVIFLLCLLLVPYYEGHWVSLSFKISLMGHYSGITPESLNDQLRMIMFISVYQ